MASFMEMLKARWAEGKFLCVGLDSDPMQIPEHIAVPDVGESILAFNLGITSKTQDLVCAFKPNLAFYLEYGRAGLEALKETIAMIHRGSPSVPVILDGKFGDIGNTSQAYASFAFDEMQADAVTVNPYLGQQAIQPFIDRADKGVIAICKTSNDGSGEFQDRLLPQAVIRDEMSRDDFFGIEDFIERDLRELAIPNYLYVAYRIAKYWNAEHGNCGVVAGATYPEELGQVREFVRNLPILIPGIGKQGGALEATVNNGVDGNGQGMIINSSRGIIFASKGEDFAEAARREAQKFSEAIYMQLRKKSCRLPEGQASPL
ncbi:MAG: orotidine-5'-phosphate decarboxylase [Patescibacteria group bacterium]